MIAVILIGRNEGARLIRALDAAASQSALIVYVDSGSTDTSVAEATVRGVLIVELDTTTPFTAARARNAGVAALAGAGHSPDYLQFLDGDCALEPGWLQAGAQELDQNPNLGIVTGWRCELFRDASVYNAMADFEWHLPAGEIKTCSGDMMVRRAAFEQVGGFDPSVIAAEDDEFCLRVGAAGWALRRLPLTMSHHDAAMTRFSEWWRRAVRSGHGFAQVGAMHPDFFVRERRRVWVFGAILPVLALVGLMFCLWLLAGVALLYGLSYLRTVKGLQNRGLNAQTSCHHAVFLTISKLPNMIGMAIYHWRKRQGAAMSIIEYK